MIGPSRRLLAGAGLLPVLVLALAGCTKQGDKTPPTKVEGRVLRNGKPLDRGIILFLKGSQVVGQSPVTAAGYYTVDGLPVGELAICISFGPPLLAGPGMPPGGPKGPPGPGGPGGPKGPPAPPKDVPMPPDQGDKQDPNNPPDPVAKGDKGKDEAGKEGKGPPRMPGPPGPLSMLEELPPEQRADLVEVYNKYGNTLSPRLRLEVRPGPQSHDIELE